MRSQSAYYFSVSSRERTWGLAVTGVGHALVRPHAQYPPMVHPAAYDFQWERGRILDEYALLYLVKGCGTFESAHQSSLQISSGNCLLLFPGEWHRYKPNERYGWEEFWLTFQGPLADSWKAEQFFRADQPVLAVADEESFVALLSQLLHLSGRKQDRNAFECAALCHLLLARSLAQPEKSPREDQVAVQLHAAGDYLRLHPETDVDLPLLAKKCGMSYSVFRRNFKAYFGESPDRFHQIARVLRLKQYLIETGLPLKEIATRLNYSSEFYMMHAFKRHTGLTPTQWRLQREVASS